MSKEHNYKVQVSWKGKDNKQIRTYSRNHTASINNKPSLDLTTDNKAVGDPTRLNPEDLLVTALASCHMLSYLYVCSLEGIVITSYRDEATGIMDENPDGGGCFRIVNLNPVCETENEEMVERAIELHHKAHEVCYIANSVNFPVVCNPQCRVKTTG